MAHEYQPFEITVDGQDIELTPTNHGIAQFRHTPEYDYIDISVEEGPNEEETKHILIFRHRWLCLWMGRVALTTEDRVDLAGTDAEHGTFFDRTGFNSRVFLEDKASEAEMEMYTESLMGDLRRTSGMPEDWEIE